MELKDLFKIRNIYHQEYVNFFNNIKDNKIFQDIELKIQKMMDFDWLLQSNHNRIQQQLQSINQKIKEISKIKNYNLSFLNKLLKIKSQLKDQEKSLMYFREKNYLKIKNEYKQIILKLTDNIKDMFKIDSQILKLNKVVIKTEKKFIHLCQNWKSEKYHYYLNIYDSSSHIMKNGTEIISSLEEHNLSDDKFQIEYLIKSKCIMLIRQIEEFKQKYPKCLTFKDNFLKNLYLDQTLEKYIKDFNFKINLIKSNKYEQPNFEYNDISFIKENISYSMSLFHDIFHLSKKSINQIEKDKNTILKHSLEYYSFHEKILLDCFNQQPNNNIYLFYEYLNEHDLK